MTAPPPSEKWDRRFLQLADQIATWSKDPSRGVGAVIVTPARQIVATGFNGLPRGFADLPERLQRPVKYDLVVHAELNAIIQCGRNGTSAIGCTVYTSFAPCVHCSLAMVQAGAGLGSAIAIMASDLVTLSPDGSRTLLATLAIAAAAALSLRAALGRETGDDGRLTLALLGTLALIAGAAAVAGASPLPGALLLGIVIANLRGGALRRLERLVADSEPAVAAVFFLFAGVMLQGGQGAWPWIAAASILAFRLLLKPLMALLALGPAWREPGAAPLRAAPIRQAPIAIVLAVAALQAHDTPMLRAALLTLCVAGFACGLLPMAWRRAR